MPDQPITYKDAGVDIDAMNDAVRRMREAVRTTYTPEVLTDVGSFGGMFAATWPGMTDPVLVSSIDGVGTKVKVAAMGGRHGTIGGDLVNHCVNDILVQGARPLFFMDYFASCKLQPDVVVDVVGGLATACKTNGCALLGGETAEMPGVYVEGEYDLAGCIVGLVDKALVVDGRTIQPGDAVVGLASSGLHTNGYSLARRVLFETAGFGLDDRPDDLGGASLADVLLAQHRPYAKSVLPILPTRAIHGMAHITGGGFYDNIPRVLPPQCSVSIFRCSWPVPPIFTLIQEIGGVPDVEMFRTFNMGIGFVLIVDRPHLLEVMQSLQDAGEQATLIGEVCHGNREVNVL